MNKLKTTLSMLALSISLSFSAKADAAINNNTSNLINTNTILADIAVAGITTSYDKYIELTSENSIKANIQLLSAVDKKSPLENLGFSIADNYVNIRSQSTTDSDVVGKLYRGSIAKITNINGEWAEIKSGKVTGYIKTEFLAIGAEGEKYLSEFTEKYATINTETLYVREEASTESRIATMVPFGETYYVNKENDGWAHIMIDEQESGFVSKDYITIERKYNYAVSIEEEQAKLAAEKAAREAQVRQEESLRREQESSKKAAAESKATSSKTSTSTVKATASSSSKGQQIANYAKQFVGNRYVYGGTSLTNGADCSGFVQSIYRQFGYSLTRVSADQARTAGRVVGLGELQAGDLIFYGSGGGINHVAIYIGDGQVVHASNARDGIKISSYNYRTPSVARRVI